MPWIAIKVPESPIDARRENTEYRVQTLTMRRNDRSQRWPTVDGPRNGQKGQGAHVRTPVTSSRAVSRSRGFLSRSWCRFIAIWGIERGLARPPGGDSHDLGSSTNRMRIRKAAGRAQWPQQPPTRDRHGYRAWGNLIGGHPGCPSVLAAILRVLPTLGHSERADVRGNQ